ncbi:CD3072 family TudS-related putative desulfidase [Alkaliphilus peptidifermentans]|uniref:Predicted secreted protein n=1 Tax=Alkaliphilus peptidifermentans DSM 18978 TaxID=1120976 RepID=A0A1G5KK58_9FIRM|nr:CD3072 family TudS-related putative desulfidase [Alkaliphilus peptidifermentans]SCZ00986.1 Predicted secreted protein [Alkaliphilus peptidifermentans DSM 18978]
MYRSKKVILLCHCILNTNTKVEGLAKKSDLEKTIIDALIENQIGIIQLPCPEFMCYGLKRWGHVRAQFDTPHFRKSCKAIFEPYADQIINYIDNDYEVLGIIGIDGSPTCGVERTCDGDWGGEWTSTDQWKERLDSIQYIDKKGIFIEEIMKILADIKVDVPFFGVSFSNTEASYEAIRKILK